MLKFLHDDDNNNDDDNNDDLEAITITRLFLQNRQAKNVKFGVNIFNSLH